MSRPPPRELGALVVAACAFAASSPLAKSVSGLSFAGIGVGRCAVAACALTAVAPSATWRSVANLDGRRRLGLVTAGVLLGAHFALFLGGLLTTSLAAAAALVSLEPIAVVLAAWVAFGVRPRPGEVGGIAVATLGALVVGRGAGTGEHTLFGDALVLGAVVIYGAYVAFARGLRDAVPARAYAASVYTVAALTMAPLLLLSRGSGPVPASSWLAVMALGLVPTLIGHTLVQRAARRVSPSLVALVSPGETVGALLLGVAFGWAPAPIEWIGAGIVLVGATLTAWSST